MPYHCLFCGQVMEVRPGYTFELPSEFVQWLKSQGVPPDPCMLVCDKHPELYLVEAGHRAYIVFRRRVVS